MSFGLGGFIQGKTERDTYRIPLKHGGEQKYSAMIIFHGF